MELPGHLWVPFFGLVNQTTGAVVGPTTAFKMQRGEVNGTADGYEVTSNPNVGVNATSGFKASITTNRQAIIRLHHASFDPLFNWWGTTIFWAEGLLVRLAIAPSGGRTAAANSFILAGQAYLFPVCRVRTNNWSPDATQGQPMDLELETFGAYSVPGETAVSFTF